MSRLNVVSLDVERKGDRTTESSLYGFIRELEVILPVKNK